ncbi:MAG: MMPL family transporter [Gammaproteobacteria bacterium]|nr:MMPL family transporter [Gammaproteobacteria bacterium]
MNLKFDHHSKLILLIWFIFTLSLSLFLFNSFSVRSDISYFLSENNNSEKKNTLDNVMKHQLTQGEAGKIIVIAISEKTPLSTPPANPLSLKHLADVNKKIALELRKNNEFLSVQNGHLSLSELLIEPYYQYRYLLHSHTEADFSIAGLSKSFNHLLQKLQFMPNPMEQKLFSEDPQMIWLNLLKQWQAEKLKIHHGVWFDQQNQQSLLFVKTRANAYDLKQQTRNIESISSIMNKIMQIDSNFNYHLTGAPVFAIESKKSIRSQIKTISMIASFTLMFFLFWLFRSIKILILTGLPLGFAVLTGMTTVIIMDGFIHGITIAFGITIIGIAVDYPVHFYSHLLFSKKDSAQHISTTENKMSSVLVMQSIWPLLRLGLITTLIGFSAITLSDFSGLRQLGLFAISGLLAATTVTRFLLPQISVYKENNNHLSSLKTLLFLVRFPIPKITYLVSIILPVIALFYIGFHQSSLWQNNLSAMSPIPQKQKQQDFELRNAMGLPELRYALILQASSIEDVLQQSELLKPLLEQLKQQTIIANYDMANNYLPSKQFQLEQQKKLPAINELYQRLEKALSTNQLSIDAFLPFIASIKQSQNMPPLTYQFLSNDVQVKQKNDFITDKIKTLLFLNKQNQESDKSVKVSLDKENWTALILLQGVQQEIPIANLNQSVNFSVQLLDLKTQTETMLSNYRNDAFLWFLLGSLLILSVLFFHNKKLSKLFIIAWPFTGAIILTIASLLLLGYSLSIFHLVTLLLVIGLGIDYSIFMILPSQSSNEITQSTEISQVSVIICLISTLIMFGALSLSDLPVLKAIGLTASLGALYSYLLARAFVTKTTG